MTAIKLFLVINLMASTALVAAEPMIHFDMPPVAVARDDSSGDRNLVTIDLKLSSMIAAPNMPRIDQWIVQCQPRSADLQVEDYSPRTEVASDISGPIEVKRTKERSSSAGTSLDGGYGHVANFHAGFDHGSKDINSVQVNRVAPVQAVTASGTINRGRGVFFKLRWTAQQVLEGEKHFQITLRVPKHWRGSLIDVSVIAQANRKTFGGWDTENKILGAAEFVVAAHREHDQLAAEHARALFEAEHALRLAAKRHPSEESSWKTLLRHVTTKLDNDDKSRANWMRRLLHKQADPHFDKVITKLPMPVRLAVLEYVDSRDAFLLMNGS